MPKNKLIKNMASKNAKLTWQQKIDKVESWLSNRKYRLIRGREKHINDSVDFDLKIVLLSDRSKPENQFYSLLHECGHILNRGKNFKRKYKALNEAEQDPRKESTFRYLTEEIEEETEAWRRGEQLSRQLDIPVDYDTYHTYASKYIMTYVVYAAKGKQYMLHKSFQSESKKTKR